MSFPTSNSRTKGKHPFFPRKPTLVGGRYLILQQLSEGAFGHTFLAEDMHLPGNPKCVLKQLKSQSGNRAMQTARRLFHQEAEVLYTLGNHPRIPQLFAHFEDQHGFYLAQEYIKGRSLSQELKMSPLFSEKDGIQLIVEILEILIFVHQQQVIHRDVKPANLIRRHADGKIVMIDFGAVKQVSKQFLNPLPNQTDYTIAIGTTGYIPNEQLGGRPRYSSDIYAVGMIGIQAMTGMVPSGLQEDERSGEVVWRNRAPDITPQFANILEKMVRYDFRLRYPSAEEALKHLKQLSQLPVWVRSSIQQPSIQQPSIQQPSVQQPSVQQPSVQQPSIQQSKPGQSFPRRLSTYASTVLPPTERHLDNDQISLLSSHHESPPFRTDYAALFQSPWVQPADNQFSLRPQQVPFWLRLDQIPHRIRKEGLAFVVPLWQQRHRLNPWYAIAILSIWGTTSIAQRRAWLSEQNNVFYAANSISSQEILAPAERLVKNLPQPDRSTEIEQHIAEQIGTYLQAATTFIDSGDHESALDLYQKVLSLDDQNVPALTQQCLFLSQRNEPESSLSACQDLLIANPENAVALWGLGKANQDMGFYRNALDYYDQSLTYSPGYGPALDGRNTAHQALQNH